MVQLKLNKRMASSSPQAAPHPPVRGQPSALSQGPPSPTCSNALPPRLPTMPPVPLLNFSVDSSSHPIFRHKPTPFSCCFPSEPDFLKEKSVSSLFAVKCLPHILSEGSPETVKVTSNFPVAKCVRFPHYLISLISLRHFRDFFSSLLFKGVCVCECVFKCACSRVQDGCTQIRIHMESRAYAVSINCSPL